MAQKGGGTTWSRMEVERDLRDSIAVDDIDKLETEDLIGQLFKLNVTHIGWHLLGGRAMIQKDDVTPASIAGPATLGCVAEIERIINRGCW